MLESLPHRRDVPAEHAVYGRTRSGTTCRATCSSRSSRRGSRFYVIDARPVARDVGMGGRVNTIMQTCFFALSGVLPRDEAIAAIKESIQKTYARQARGGRRAELRRGGGHARPSCTEVTVPVGIASGRDATADRAATRPRFRAARDGRDDGGQAATCCR